MVGTVVAKFHFEGFGTAGQSHDLMAQANAKGRNTGFDQLGCCRNGVIARLRIARTVGQKDAVRFVLEHISRWGLGGRLGVSAEEAQAMIDRYFERFPGIQRYIHETLETVRAKGYSETLFGRKTWFPRINSKNQAERQGSERAAINAPIQGTSADIIKRAMVRMEPALEAAGLGHVRMLLQVHDELVFELPEGDVEAAKPVILGVMAGAAAPAVHLDVPLGVEIGTGLSWGAAH